VVLEIRALSHFPYRSSCDIYRTYKVGLVARRRLFHVSNEVHASNPVYNALHLGHVGVALQQLFHLVTRPGFRHNETPHFEELGKLLATEASHQLSSAGRGCIEGGLADVAVRLPPVITVMLRMGWLLHQHGSLPPPEALPVAPPLVPSTAARRDKGVILVILAAKAIPALSFLLFLLLDDLAATELPGSLGTGTSSCRVPSAT